MKSENAELKSLRIKYSNLCNKEFNSEQDSLEFIETHKEIKIVRQKIFDIVRRKYHTQFLDE